jgi:hypothetical protein
MLLPATLLLGIAADPNAVPTEPPPPTCVPATVVSTAVGPTIKVLRPGERLVTVTWKLSDGHTYVSQTGDDASVPGKKVEKATDELRKPGAHVKLCTFAPPAGAYPYLIHTLDDNTNRAAKRIH